MDANQSLKLLWSEDFSDKDPLSFEKKWNFDIGDGSSHGLVGWGNNELEYYTKEAVTYGNGLTISAKRNLDPDLNCYYGNAQWTSGKIHTAGKVSFKYGRIEVRAKTPSGVGTWPAIWLLGGNLLNGTVWPSCGEIDILETTGANPRQIQGTIHGPGYFGENGLTKIIQSPEDLADEYHDFAIEWAPDRIDWFFDGKSYNSIARNGNELGDIEWPFNQEFYLILNLAIGGWFAGEVDPNLAQAKFEVMSIKHYSVNGVGSVRIS